MLKTVATLGANGALTYLGTWNASTNTPTLTSSVGLANNYYVVSVAGTTNLNGITNWQVGDWAIFNGSVWERIEGGASESFANLTVTGTGNIVNFVSGNVSITGGNVTGLANLSWTNEAPGYTNYTTSAQTITLTNTATYYQHFAGTSTATLKLPDETTVSAGTAYIIDNDSTGNVTVQDSGGTLLATVTPGMAGYIYSLSNASSTGNWAGYAYAPGAGPTGQVIWGTSGLNMGGANLSGVNIANITSATITNFSTGNVTITGGTINVQTVNHTTTTTSNATMSTASIPLVPQGYLEYDLNGTVVKIPYYAV
jgi:hypothetical protein